MFLVIWSSWRGGGLLFVNLSTQCSLVILSLEMTGSEEGGSSSVVCCYQIWDDSKMGWLRHSDDMMWALFPSSWLVLTVSLTCQLRSSAKLMYILVYLLLKEAKIYNKNSNDDCNCAVSSQYSLIFSSFSLHHPHNDLHHPLNRKKFQKQEISANIALY